MGLEVIKTITQPHFPDRKLWFGISLKLTSVGFPYGSKRSLIRNPIKVMINVQKVISIFLLRLRI